MLPEGRQPELAEVVLRQFVQFREEKNDSLWIEAFLNPWLTYFTPPVPSSLFSLFLQKENLHKLPLVDKSFSQEVDKAFNEALKD